MASGTTCPVSVSPRGPSPRAEASGFAPPANVAAASSAQPTVEPPQAKSTTSWQPGDAVSGSSTVLVKLTLGEIVHHDAARQLACALRRMHHDAARATQTPLVHCTNTRACTCMLSFRVAVRTCLATDWSGCVQPEPALTANPQSHSYVRVEGAHTHRMRDGGKEGLRAHNSIYACFNRHIVNFKLRSLSYHPSRPYHAIDHVRTAARFIA